MEENNTTPAAHTEGTEPAPHNAAEGTTARFIPFGTLIKRAFSESVGSIANYAWFVLASLVLVGVVVGVVFGLAYTLIFTNVEATTGMFVGLSVGALVAYLVLIAAGIVLFHGYFYAVLKRGERVSFARGCRVALSLFWSIVWIAILSNLVINTGMMLLLIPGIAISVYLLFIAPVVLTEEQRGLNALVRSTNLVHNHWWGVAGRMLGMMLLWALVGAAAGITVAVAATKATATVGIGLGIVLGLTALYLLNVTFHAMALMFESLTSLKPAAAFAPEHHPRVRRLYFWFAIVGIPATIILSAMDSAGEPDPFMDNNFDPAMFESMEGGENIEDLEQYGFIE